MTNLDLIKQTYMKCQGNTMHMAREYCDVYEMYKQLDPGEDILKEWDLELLESLFAMLWEDPGFVWGRHGQIIEVLNRGRVDIGYWVARLLDEMEKMDTLDKESKVLIIENMAGRDLALKGGCMLLETFPAHAERVDWIMNKIMDFTYSENGLLNKMGFSQSDRLEKAKAAYRRAFRKWTANQ